MPGVTTAYQSGTHAARPAATSGCILYACTDHTLIYRSDGSTWATWASLTGTPLGAWTTFTPTWTTTGTAPAIGNGTLTGRYKALDSKTYIIVVRFVAGSTTTYGTGTWEFALPAGLTANGVHTLDGYIEDTGTDNKLCSGVIFSGATKIGQVVPEAGNVVNNTTPQTWANGDKMYLDGIIEVV